MVKHFVVALVLVGAAGRPAAGQQEREHSAEREQQVQARYNIFVMEGVLERAVAHGAERLSRQVRRVMPNMLFVSGEAQARGFRLDGYGVFFDVSVPVMRQSVAWSLRNIMPGGFGPGATLQELKTAVEQSVRDAQERAALLQVIKRLEGQVGPPTLSGATPAAGQPVADRGAVTALDAPEPEEPPLTPEDAALLEDPNAAYEREVVTALKDAMLDHSGSIRIGPDEWLTVAARDNEHRNRLVPGDPYDLLTIVLRVKGSDLAAFRADRITRDEARTRVIVSEF